MVAIVGNVIGLAPVAFVGPVHSFIAGQQGSALGVI
jgi:hypothetical protein